MVVVQNNCGTLMRLDSWNGWLFRSVYVHTYTEYKDVAVSYVPRENMVLFLQMLSSLVSFSQRSLPDPVSQSPCSQSSTTGAIRRKRTDSDSPYTIQYHCFLMFIIDEGAPPAY